MSMCMCGVVDMGGWGRAAHLEHGQQSAVDRIEVGVRSTFIKVEPDNRKQTTRAHNSTDPRQSPRSTRSQSTVTLCNL